MKQEIRKILFIRRDNIGDLICTTPAIHAARKSFPDAKVGILVNSYNAEAVVNNPDIDEMYVYQKAKHAPEKNRLRVWRDNMRVLKRIRAEKYDVALGCGGYSPRLERYTYFTGARVRIGYLKPGLQKRSFYTQPLPEPKAALHETERVFTLLTPLGIKGTPPPMTVLPPEEEVKELLKYLTASAYRMERPCVSFHISSRRSENRWSAENFIKLGRMVSKQYGANILLLWSPGSERNVHHPGDDEKAKVIAQALPNVLLYRTVRLSQLIAALSLCNLLVCSDGGAMHIAAALRKPIAAIWGSTDPVRWSPWGTKHIIVRNGTEAANVTCEDVLNAIDRLL